MAWGESLFGNVGSRHELMIFQRAVWPVLSLTSEGISLYLLNIYHISIPYSMLLQKRIIECPKLIIIRS
jgi:hypothetical protein